MKRKSLGKNKNFNLLKIMVFFLFSSLSTTYYLLPTVFCYAENQPIRLVFKYQVGQQLLYEAMEEKIMENVQKRADGSLLRAPTKPVDDAKSVYQIKNKVLAIDPSGRFVIEEEYKTSQFYLFGTDSPRRFKDAPSHDWYVDPQGGRFLIDQDGKLIRQKNFYYLSLPTEPVKVGDQWQDEVVIQSLPVTVTFSLKGVKKSGKRRLAEIEAVYEGSNTEKHRTSMMETLAEGTGSFLFDLEAGNLFEENLNVDFSKRKTVYWEEKVDRILTTTLTIKYQQKRID